MKRALALLQATVLLFLAGYAHPQVASFQPPTVGAATPWTQQGFKADPNDFRFAIVSDRADSPRPGVFEQAVAKLNLLRPEFVICVGDLIEGYTTDPEVLDRQFDEIDDILGGLEMRFFRVAGNHDITNSVMLEVYRERYGSPYYHFLYKDVLFLVVSTEEVDKPSRIDKAQVAYMQNALRDHPDVRWTFVFMHNPLFVDWKGRPPPLSEGWTQIENALKGRPHTVFAGHRHQYAKYEKQGQSYIHLATTGGGSRLRGTAHGEFDHIVWVTMTGTGPRIANLMLDGIFDENVRPAKQSREPGLIRTLLDSLRSVIGR